MPNFFQQNPSKQDSFQKAFLDSIFHKQNVVGSFPLGHPILSLYSFPAMLGEGLAIAVCPDRAAARRNGQLLQTSCGMAYPDIAVMDGRQMPHEEREIQDLIAKNRIQLIVTTPEKFSSINFIQMLAHAQVSFIAIEDAHYLLEGFYGSYRYQRLWEGLNYFRRFPPLVLFTQLLSSSRRQELIERLGVSGADVFRKDPRLENTTLRLEMLLTEHQKFQTLLRIIQGPVKSPSMPFRSGTVLIQTYYPHHCEELQQSLIRCGFPDTYVYHQKIPLSERQHIERLFRHQKDMIVVATGENSRWLIPPQKQSMKIIQWQLPPGLDEVAGQFYRVQPAEDLEDAAETGQRIEGVILYTKEDYHALVKRIQSHAQTPPPKSRHATSPKPEPHPPDVRVKQRPEELQLKELIKVRQWILSPECRRQSLLDYWNAADADILPPCGTCDRCRPDAPWHYLTQPLQRLIF